VRPLRALFVEPPKDTWFVMCDVLALLVSNRTIPPLQRVKACAVKGDGVSAGQHVSQKGVFTAVPHLFSYEESLNGVVYVKVTGLHSCNCGNPFV
jgi:hypothetical protein